MGPPRLRHDMHCLLQNGAKKHFEDAMQRVIDRRNAADDAVYGGGAPA